MTDSTDEPYSRRDQYLEDAGKHFRGPESDPQELLEEFAEDYGLDLESVFPELDPDYFEDAEPEKLPEWKHYLTELADEAAEEFYSD